MQPAIQVSGLTKHYHQVRALDGVDIEVQQGEFFALLGPNGAGKTTLINVLAGLVRADFGEARIMGHHVVKEYRQTRRLLGVVPQELVFDPFFTVREALRIQSGYFGLRGNDDWIDELMHHLGLTAKADANMRQLSGGMKRRVLVAQALVHRPPVIILDEPTAGVDVELRQSLWAFIRKLNLDGHTVILTTHYLEEAELLCRRVAMLKAGRIVAMDTTRNLLASSPERRLRVRLDPPALPGALLDSVMAVENDGFMLRLRDYAELESVLAELRSAGVQIVEAELIQPDLEDVFVRIMSRTE
jgi:ABC-2 type transport system ATP-binding protein